MPETTARCTCHGLPGTTCKVHGDPTPGVPPAHLTALAHDGTPLTGDDDFVMGYQPFTAPGDTYRHGERERVQPRCLSILETAGQAITTSRAQDYGPAVDGFTRAGKLWAAILGLDEVTPEQYALCMAAVKISRLVETPNHADSWVDLAGYAALGGEIASYQPGQ